MAKTILITGGTGLVGTRLTQLLNLNDYKVIILTRNPKQYAPNAMVRYAAWDVKTQTIDAAAIADAHAIVHLAGAGVVDKPWTAEYKKEILDSRVNSAALLVQAMRSTPNNIQTVVSASAIGWYGPSTTNKPFVETDPPAKGFLGATCQAWETAITPVQDLGKRLVTCRFGIVLSIDGGALKEFLKPLKMRVASVLGNGKQVVSWIHIDDLCHIIIQAIDNTNMQGVYNAVAPNPVTNKQLNLTLGKALYNRAFIAMPVPAFALRMLMGDRSEEVLKSTNVSAEKILKTGYHFKYPVINNAVDNLV